MAVVTTIKYYTISELELKHISAIVAGLNYITQDENAFSRDTVIAAKELCASLNEGQ